MLLRWSPLQLSLLLHALLGVFFVTIIFFPQHKIKESYTVPIQYPDNEAPEEVKQLKEIQKTEIVLKSVNKTQQEMPSKVPPRQVFGLSRDSYTDNSNSDGIAVKQGNTIAKAQDDLQLRDDDLTALPTPTEEYLVSEMPQMIYEAKATYPKEARDQRIEGAIAMDILIDSTGNVRQVQIVDGQAIFREVAKAAMAKYKFKPAKVDGKAVAVRIRFVIRFELET